jgi:uncharacterized protein (TIGR02597 family)
MTTTALRLSPLALAALLVGTCISQAQVTTAFTDPVGYYTVNISGSSDNILSLPMVRDAAFAGTVASGAGTVTATGFTALAGLVSPNWQTAPNKQWVYVAVTQPLTYYVEFTSGQLKGLYYKIVDNGSNTLTLDTEGDDLTNHPINGAPAALAAGDSFKIRPYWRIRDVFENAGVPTIEPRPAFNVPKDDILIPDYIAVGINKAASAAFYYLDNGVPAESGWRSTASPVDDRGDTILRPNEAFILRRRNALPLSITNLGSVQMIRSISFIPGGNGTKGNDTYISINRPASVTLEDSGLRNDTDQSLSVIRDSVDPDLPGDRLLAFSPGTGFNRAPTRTYYYLQNAGWRQFPNATNDAGGTLLEPGTAYIVRKTTATNSGRDWVNDPNY